MRIFLYPQKAENVTQLLYLRLCFNLCQPIGFHPFFPEGRHRIICKSPEYRTMMYSEKPIWRYKGQEQVSPGVKIEFSGIKKKQTLSRCKKRQCLFFYSFGRITSNAVPFISEPDTVISPPCSSAIFCAIGRPSPLPCMACDVSA